MRKFKDLMANLSICMAVALMVIAVLNDFNPMMAFLSGRVTKIYIFIFGAVVIVSSVLNMTRRKRR